MTRQLVILAGGKGTRLKDRLGDLPKPMIPIAGRPLLEHQVELARQHGFTEVLMFVHHRADLIQTHFGDGRRWGLRVDYVVEKEPLGTAGAVLAGLDRLAEQFVVMYGDTMVNVDLPRLCHAHEQSRADATLLLHPNNHPLDSDLVEMEAHGRVTAFHNRPHPAGRFFQNLVNAGLYVLNKRTLQAFVSSRREEALFNAECGMRNAEFKSEPPHVGCYSGPPLDFGKDLFPAMLARGVPLHGYNSPEFIKDIGTPARYDWVCAQYAAGIIQRSSLATPQRAVFLDRDGTLVKEVSRQGLSSPDQLELLPGVAEAIHGLNQAGLRAVVVTNQPVIAKGFCTEAGLQVIHNKLETLLGREHAFLDRIYFCPHHPEKGFPGERVELKIDCACRKPKTGLIEQAVRDLNIDRAQSWLIGDTTTDLQTAKNAGLRSILVRTGYGGSDGKESARADFVFDDLGAAVRFVVERGH
ncbi:MAG: HAD-IIIA family hydrolase [Verrucomicrobia bacterium]|nr:HAD-IIIA family hydrolase [Verrucomicrobiota bacterium]